MQPNGGALLSCEDFSYSSLASGGRVDPVRRRRTVSVEDEISVQLPASCAIAALRAVPRPV